MSTETYRVRVIPDDDAQAPDTWEDPGAWLVTTDNRHFSTKREGWTLERAQLVAEGKPDAGDESFVAFPLYAYIHSGVALSLGRDYPFNCPWDSGQIGYTVVDRRELCDTPAAPWEAAKQLVETWNQYLSGDVWGYVLERVSTCDHGEEHSEHVDSRFGFYGRGYAEQEANEALAFATKGSTE